MAGIAGEFAARGQSCRRLLTRPAPDSTATLSSRDLIHLARKGDASAIAALFVRLEPVLRRMARRSGIQPDLQREVVETFLGDIILALCEMSIVPLKADGYVLRAFHNRLADYHREAAHRDRMSGEAMSRLAGSAEEAIISCCSEHALRSAAGPDSYAREPAPAVLTAMLDEILAPLGDPDRAVLTWISYRVPAHDIANWLGISAPTTKVRIHRLRNRLKRAAALYARRLDEKERAELAKYVPELGQSEEGE